MIRAKHKSADVKAAQSDGTDPLSHSLENNNVSDIVSVAHTLGIVRHRRHSFHHTGSRKHHHHHHGHHHHHHSHRHQHKDKSLLSDAEHYGSLDTRNKNSDSDSRKSSASESSELFDWRNDRQALRSLIFGSYLNIFLILLPFCFISYYADWNGAIVFFINFLTMIPLASILGDATECLAEHLGDIIGGLLNATFGNAVEIVVTLLALIKAKHYADKDDCERKEDLLFVVQTSLIGSIFSNSLLVLGCVLFGNGIKYAQSKFNTTAVSSSVSLLMIAGFVMILPAPYAQLESNTDELMISRAAAIILILMYCCSLLFVLYTHRDMIETPNDSNESNEYQTQTQTQQRTHSNSFSLKPIAKTITNNNSNNSNNSNNTNNSNNGATAPVSDIVTNKNENIYEHDIETPDRDNDNIEDVGNEEDNDSENEDEDAEDDELEMSLIGSVLLLLVSTILVAVLSEYLVDTIEPMTDKLGMQEAFVGVILIPIIGNAVEHLTAVRMALKNKMDIALSIAIGSAAQVALFVVPLSVIVAWMMDLDLSLDFESFEVYMFILSSIIIYAIVNDGKSNWLEGVMLLGLYVLIGIAVWDQKLEYDC